MSMTADFRFTIEWIDSIDGEPVVTMARMRALLDGTQFWPAPTDAPDGGPMEWYADQFLAHLVRHWKRLLVEQGYPVTDQPSQPSDIWESARAQWSGQPESYMVDLQDKIISFEKCHDLSNAFSGIYQLAPFWIVREYNTFVIDNGSQCIRVAFNTVVEALAKIGDLIADRLRQKGGRKWDRLLSAWQGRNQGDPRRLLSLSTRLDDAVMDTLLQEGLLAANDNVFEAALETEVKVAARMAATLPSDSIATILRAVLSTSKGDYTTLDQWTADLTSRMDGCDAALPYEQGVLAAEYFRDMLNISKDQKADPFAILEQAGVSIREDVFNPDVDAVACWGPKHGPAVLFNSKANRLKMTKASLRNSGQGRVTAAHELCHLLLDRDSMMSAVEVLNGRTPTMLEQRARAFAAAFLLPKFEALKQWDGEGQPVDHTGVKRVLSSLTTRFGVTMTVAAWKLEHGVDPSDPQYPTLWRALRTFVVRRRESGGG